ncbi:cytoplasmic protein NCK2-like isoform X1 [Varroa destructor]|uniref:Uncharacterized protein n=1 Tax=Varroa destructor TaxID=109461 RepID=A0A7M7KBQ2_VARDE|nr:cytoplasmic protein NCK2-like isoform X1 [Varroa destructor]XP_022664484.1 cytoplasmic protein NCK2-like isoform X1 [Varroa destructor]
MNPEMTRGGKYDLIANSGWPTLDRRAGSLPIRLEPVTETVVTQFAFQARQAEELSFGKGERLTILERFQGDPNWLLAANCLGQEGLVPINYLQSIETSTGSGNPPLLSWTLNQDSAANGKGRVNFMEYQHQPWFFGSISRAYADVLFNAFGSVGDFLVRNSESSASDLSLTVRGPGRNRHFLIHVENIESFHIGHRKFFHLNDLVEYYKRIPICTTPQGYKLYLVKAFKKP